MCIHLSGVAAGLMSVCTFGARPRPCCYSKPPQRIEPMTGSVIRFVCLQQNICRLLPDRLESLPEFTCSIRSPIAYEQSSHHGTSADPVGPLAGGRTAARFGGEFKPHAGVPAHRH